MWKLAAPLRQLSRGLNGAVLMSVRFASAVPLDRMRNFGVSAHVDSGKTTLTERILFYTGRIEKIHEVGGRDGVGAVMDSMKQERERGITIKSAATFAEWRDTFFNIIDTPGHIDFTVEVERSLRVLDGAILVICACGGVQSQTLTVDRQMKRYSVPRIIFINKLDRKEAQDVTEIVKEARSRMAVNAALVQLPVGYGHSPLGHEGIIDIITRKYLTFEGSSGSIVKENPIPGDYAEDVEARRSELIECLAEVDDDLGEKYLMDEEPTEEEIHAAIRKGTIERTFTPVFVGSAKGNKGVQPLLDGVSRYLPSPNEVDNFGITVKEGEEHDVVLKSDPKEDLVAMAFKIDMLNKRPLTYVRVYQGTLKKGDTVRLAPRGSDNWKETKTAKVVKLVKMHSNELEEVDRISAGEIGGAEGLECSSGDTLVNASQKTMVSCESIFVPAPVISLMVKVKDPKDTQNMMAKLRRFEREDPTFKYSVNEETNDLSISGMGELHLDIFVQRLKSEENIEVITGKPFVQFREYLPIEDGEELQFDYRHKKQSGGRGQFAQITGHLTKVDTPLSTRDTEPKTAFSVDMIGAALPENFQKSVRKAFDEVVIAGPILGAPVWGLKMTVTGGQTHEVDSSDFAFMIATKDLLTEMFTNHKATLLEPVMEVEIVVPLVNLSDITALLAEKMGDMKEIKQTETEATVKAEVTLRNMFGFIGELRARTKGLGEFSMEYSHHEEVPHREAMVIAEERKKELASR